MSPSPSFSVASKRSSSSGKTKTGGSETSLPGTLDESLRGGRAGNWASCATPWYPEPTARCSGKPPIARWSKLLLRFPAACTPSSSAEALSSASYSVPSSCASWRSLQCPARSSSLGTTAVEASSSMAFEIPLPEEPSLGAARLLAQAAIVSWPRGARPPALRSASRTDLREDLPRDSSPTSARERPMIRSERTTDQIATRRPQTRERTASQAGVVEPAHQRHRL